MQNSFISCRVVVKDIMYFLLSLIVSPITFVHTTHIKEYIGREEKKMRDGNKRKIAFFFLSK